MKKLAISLLFAFLLFSGFSDSQVWVKAKMPYTAYAGDKFTLEITINKLDLQNYAEFKQTLPAGFSAVEKQSGSAIFSFKNQVVKFTWMRLPRTPKVTLSYDIIVKENIQGQHSLPGKFTYIYKNERGEADLTNDKIVVIPKGGNVRNNNQPITENLTYPPKDPLKVQCLRVKPQYFERQNGYVVRLLVSSGNIKGNAKIEETIPLGYTATIIEGKGSAFTFENNKVEFYWLKIPEKNSFEISYKLVHKTNKAVDPAIAGNMIYLNNGMQMNVPVYQIGNKN